MLIGVSLHHMCPWRPLCAPEDRSNMSGSKESFSSFNSNWKCRQMNYFKWHKLDCIFLLPFTGCHICDCHLEFRSLSDKGHPHYFGGIISKFGGREEGTCLVFYNLPFLHFSNTAHTVKLFVLILTWCFKTWHKTSTLAFSSRCSFCSLLTSFFSSFLNSSKILFGKVWLAFIFCRSLLS